MKLCVINNSTAHYRAPIYQLIDQTWECRFILGKMPEIKSMDVSLLKSVKIVDNKTFIRRPLYYLSNTISLLFDKNIDTFLMAGEAYCLSTWLMLVLRPFFSPRKNIYLWTHGWYGREGFLKKWILRFRTALCKGIFTYGDYARDEAIRQGNPQNRIFTIHNSLDHVKQVEQRLSLNSENFIEEHFGNRNHNIVFIGRLTKVKKLDMLLKALSALKEKGEEYNLVLVGDGSERKCLENLSEKYGIVQNVWFMGECYDESLISRVIFNCDLCVSPGNVGLTAMHCLVFGTPVLTHDNFTRQMPEFESIKKGKTGDFYKENDLNDLIDKISKWFVENASRREEIREECFREIDTYWTPEYQLSVLKKNLK